MPNGHDIVVIGASSGGVEALRRIVSGLPEDLPAAVFVVIHLLEEVPSALPKILDRAGPLEAVRPRDGEPIEKGRVYAAVPDHHMLIEDGRVRMARGPMENRHRPAADPLFRSAAIAYGPRVVGVILTGALNDGTAGLLAVKRRGGIAVVQDPNEALFSGMPESALHYVEVDHCVPLGEVAPLLVRLSREDVPAEKEGADRTVPDEMRYEVRMAGLDSAAAMQNDYQIGELSRFTCPECTGPLFEIREEEGLLRYRYRVGHAHAAESLIDEKAETLENALYVALNTLQENADMTRSLAKRSRESEQEHAARRFEERARNMEEKAAAVRQVLTEGTADPSVNAV
ncbi:MAG: chemotaxis protein CheB [Actinomycetota bacterium]|nr:chemotaxis protein CheB [Actinomycetota bacterium]